VHKHLVFGKEKVQMPPEVTKARQLAAKQEQMNGG